MTLAEPSENRSFLCGRVQQGHIVRNRRRRGPIPSCSFELEPEAMSFSLHVGLPPLSTYCYMMSALLPPYPSHTHRKVSGPDAVVQHLRESLQEHNHPRRKRHLLRSPVSGVRQVAELGPRLRRRARHRCVDQPFPLTLAAAVLVFIDPLGTACSGGRRSVTPGDVCGDKGGSSGGAGGATVNFGGGRDAPVSRSARLKNLSLDECEKRCA